MGKEAALPKNIRQIGDIHGRQRICIEDYVMTYIRKKETQEAQGYLGLFLGEEKVIEDNSYLFVRGVLEIPSEDLEEEALYQKIKEEQEQFFPGKEVIGSCVIGAYPAARMEKLSSMLPESGRLLYHLQEQEESLYRMENGQYQKVRGYFVFYEQNQEMQEYLSESFKEDHVEKESLPDTAIRSFREKVKEKGMKKHGSFLRLASSFLVLTVLVICAIAVNRVEEIRTIQNLSRDVTRENEVVPDEEMQDQTVQAAQVLGGSDLFWEEIPEDLLMPEAEAVSMEKAENMQSETEYMQGKTEYMQGETEYMQGETECLQSETEHMQMESELMQSETDSMQSETREKNTERDAQEASVRQIQASYVIKAGDTLADICSRYYGSLEKLEDICQINEISDANLIMPGQKILLP